MQRKKVVHGLTTTTITSALVLSFATAFPITAGDLAVDNLNVYGNMTVTSAVTGAFNDKSENANHASGDGPVSGSTGKIGLGCSFTGTGELHTQTSSSLDSAFGRNGQSLGYAVAMWFSPASNITPTSNTAEAHLFDYEGQVGVHFNETGAPGKLTHRVCHYPDNPNWHVYASSRDTWLAGTWYHVVCMWDRTAGVLRTYVNGTLDSSMPCSLAPKNWWNYDMEIGGWIETCNFLGMIDECRLYDRPLSEEEVGILSTQTGSELPPNLAAGLVAYYDFDGVTAETQARFAVPAVFDASVIMNSNLVVHGIANLIASNALQLGAVPAVDFATKTYSDTGVANVQASLSAHQTLTTSAHGGIIAATDTRLSDARTPLAHTHPGPEIVSAVGNANQLGGLAASSYVTNFQTNVTLSGHFTGVFLEGVPYVAPLGDVNMGVYTNR